MALDTTTTPFKRVERVLGGSASYFALAASFFHPTAVVSAVGGDFPQKYWDLLAERGIDLSCVQRKKDEKTMFFDSSFGYDLHGRKANKLELNVFEDFVPDISETLAKSEYVYLGTLLPSVQKQLLLETPKKKFAFMDTIEYYIQTDKKGLEQVLSEVDGVVLNDVEARMLCGVPQIIKAGKKLLDYGMKLVIIKKGEHGSMVFSDDGSVLPFPAVPLEEIVDPTGAGDSFAGGFVGHIARCGGKLDERTIKQAVAYANVMGSFAVEKFGVDGLKRTPAEVEKRFEEYKHMISVY
ncbi:MAG: PfkB family carbohydrate kinase [Candidatus Micrarchaeia archaeon]